MSGAMTLPDLAQAIEAEHQAALGAAQTAMGHAVACGRLLTEAKAHVAHGEWLPWIEANCTVRPRTAQVYMQLARELPRLSEEKAQRVALLTVREAIVAVSKQTASIAALPPQDQDQLIERVEANGERLATARHHVQRAAALHALELAKPPVRPARAAGPDRRMRLLKNRKTQCFLLVIGPNLAGLYLHELLRELKDRGDYRAEQDEIDELARAADELEKQARAKRREAVQRSRDLDSRIAEDLIWENGPIRPFIETADYIVERDEFDELARLTEQEAIAALLARNMAPVKRGYWGDISHSRFVTLEPATEWTGIGNEHGLPQEVVASLNPGGEAAP